MMRLNKKFCAVTTAAFMSFSASIPAFADTVKPTASIQFNGKILTNAAELTNGSTYVKASDIKNLFGVDYASEGKNLVSVRELADKFGYILGWDDKEKTVVLVDVDRMANEKNATFSILESYLDYTNSLGDSFKTTAKFNGGVEVTDNTEKISVPFSGEVTGLSSKTGAEASVKMNIDFSSLKNGIIAEEDKVVYDLIIKALESSETKVITDADKGVIYIKSTILSVIGIDENTWLSIDFNSLSDSTGDLDMKSLIDLAQKGDIKGYILSVLKSLPVDTVESYNDISTAYDAIVAMLADSSFKLDGNKYTSTYTYSEDGDTFTYTMALGKDGEKVNACDITFKMDSNDLKADMTVSATGLNSKMSFTVNAVDLMKIYFDFVSESAVTAEVHATTVPEGVNVVSINDILTSTMEEMPEAAAEKAA